MKATVLYGPGDIRFEDRDDPKIIERTDAILQLVATCVCGSDLWPYRGLQPIDGPTPMGHEYRGIVEEVGNAVKSNKGGAIRDRLVLRPPTTPVQIASTATSPPAFTGNACRGRRRRSCVWRKRTTLAPTPGGVPSKDLVPGPLAASDVLGTGWFAADRADQGPAAAVRSTHMAEWTKEEVRKISEADDLQIAPFREDGLTYGTPTCDMVCRSG